MRIKVIKRVIHSCRECDCMIHINSTGYMDRLGGYMNVQGTVLGKYYCDLARRRDDEGDIAHLARYPIENPDEIPEICPLDDDERD